MTDLDLTRVAKRYHGELAGAMERLAGLLWADKLTIKQFLAAQERTYRAYVLASKRPECVADPEARYREATTEGGMVVLD